jgi:hypothetical protein
VLSPVKVVCVVVVAVCGWLSFAHHPAIPRRTPPFPSPSSCSSVRASLAGGATGQTSAFQLATTRSVATTTHSSHALEGSTDPSDTNQSHEAPAPVPSRRLCPAPPDRRPIRHTVDPLYQVQTGSNEFTGIHSPPATYLAEHQHRDSADFIRFDRFWPCPDRCRPPFRFHFHFRFHLPSFLFSLFLYFFSLSSCSFPYRRQPIRVCYAISHRKKHEPQSAGQGQLSTGPESDETDRLPVQVDTAIVSTPLRGSRRHCPELPIDSPISREYYLPACLLACLPASLLACLLALFPVGACRHRHPHHPLSRERAPRFTLHARQSRKVRAIIGPCQPQETIPSPRQPHSLLDELAVSRDSAQIDGGIPRLRSRLRAPAGPPLPVPAKLLLATTTLPLSIPSPGPAATAGITSCPPIASSPTIWRIPPTSALPAAFVRLQPATPSPSSVPWLPAAAIRASSTTTPTTRRLQGPHPHGKLQCIRSGKPPRAAPPSDYPAALWTRCPPKLCLPVLGMHGQEKGPSYRHQLLWPTRPAQGMHQ